MTKTRLVLPVLAALAAVVIAGCGGGGSSSSEAANFAAPGSVVFVEGKVRPSGSLKSDADSVAQIIAGDKIGNSLGDWAVSELEKSAREDGEPFDYEKEVEPWLGETAAVAFSKLEEGNLDEPLVLFEASDEEAAKEFVEKQTEKSKVPYRDGSYEGVEFKVGGKEGNAIGVLDGFLVIGNDEGVFKEAVDSSNGESLADQSRFADAIGAATSGSLADVYVDVGALIEQSGNSIDSQAREVLQNAGIDPSEATAVASVIPGSDQIEVDLSSDLGGEEPASGDASDLLGELPAESFAAVGASGFNDQLEKALDELDARGIPGELEPHQLKSTLKAIGIDLDKTASSLEAAAVFAVGSDKASLGGALVVTSSSGEAAKTVANLGVLLRNTGTPGVTAVNGKASGFSVRTPELGRKPLVVVAKGTRVAIAYGLAPALQGLGVEGGETLSESPGYKAAVAALGGTPISAFVDGPAALHLAESLVPHSEAGFQEAKPYLKKISYVALGAGTSGELATAKLIAGLEK